MLELFNKSIRIVCSHNLFLPAPRFFSRKVQSLKQIYAFFGIEILLQVKINLVLFPDFRFKADFLLN